MSPSPSRHRAQRPAPVRHRAHVRVRFTIAGTFLASALCAVPILTTYVAQTELGASVSGQGHQAGHHATR